MMMVVVVVMMVTMVAVTVMFLVWLSSSWWLREEKVPSTVFCLHFLVFSPFSGFFLLIVALLYVWWMAFHLSSFPHLYCHFWVQRTMISHLNNYYNLPTDLSASWLSFFHLYRPNLFSTWQPEWSYKSINHILLLGGLNPFIYKNRNNNKNHPKLTAWHTLQSPSWCDLLLSTTSFYATLSLTAKL